MKRNYNDIEFLKKILKNQGREDLAILLNHAHSKVNETTTYGSRWYSVISDFEIFTTFENFQLLSSLSEADKQIIFEAVRIIYPLRDDSPEITAIIYTLDPQIEYFLKDEAIKLKKSEIFRIVNDYIGVNDGYLNNFSYRTHAEFYPYYCDLDINPNRIQGTTRERFITILESSDPKTQAAILKGVLKKFPIESFVDSEKEQKRIIAVDIEQYIERLEEKDKSTTLESPALIFTNETVERAISDARTLIKQNGATSGIDRVHTALHGYLKQVCLESGIELTGDPTITELYKKIRLEHPKLKETITRQDDIDKILRAFANVMDVLNPIRNMASVAHPNENLLNEVEAELVINAAHTMLYYLNSKFKS